MRNAKWMVLPAAVLAMGLIAAGCGSDNSTSSSTPADTTATTGGDSTTSGGGGATSDDVLNACLDVIKGTAAESAGQSACQKAADAFDQCQTTAEGQPPGDARDLAVQACPDA